MVSRDGLMTYELTLVCLGTDSAASFPFPITVRHFVAACLCPPLSLLFLSLFSTLSLASRTRMCGTCQTGRPPWDQPPSSSTPRLLLFTSFAAHPPPVRTDGYSAPGRVSRYVSDEHAPLVEFPSSKAVVSPVMCRGECQMAAVSRHPTQSVRGLSPKGLRDQSQLLQPEEPFGQAAQVVRPCNLSSSRLGQRAFDPIQYEYTESHSSTTLMRYDVRTGGYSYEHQNTCFQPPSSPSSKWLQNGEHEHPHQPEPSQCTRTERERGERARLQQPTRTGQVIKLVLLSAQSFDAQADT